MSSLEIAKKDLLACFDTYGIVAGRHQYDNYWTRDAYYGWLGALQLNKPQIVRSHLEMLAEYQTKTGHIPFLIRHHFPGLTFLNIKVKTKLQAFYASPKTLGYSKVIDSNAYFIYGAFEYLKVTKDKKLIKNLLPKLEKAFEWYTAQLDDNDLIKEGYIAQWNDGIYKKGYTAVTNIQVYHAGICMGKLLDELKQPSQKYIDISNNVYKAIIKNFWNGTFLIDWIEGKNKYDYFDTIANMLAIEFGVLNKASALRTLEYAKLHTVEGALAKTSYPKYDYGRAELVNRVFGVAQYWVGYKVFWIEPILLMAQAYKAVGKIEEAEELLDNVSNLITKHEGIFETYIKTTKSFEPFRTTIYRAEHPYARGAGMFLYVNKSI